MAKDIAFKIPKPVFIIFQSAQMAFNRRNGANPYPRFALFNMQKPILKDSVLIQKKQTHYTNGVV